MPLGNGHVPPATAPPSTESAATLPVPEQPPAPVQSSPEPSTPPASQPAPTTPITQTPSPAPAANTDANAWYRPEPAGLSPQIASASTDTLSWEAEEFAHHAKSSGWYGLAVVAAVVIAAVVYFINRDIITSVIVLLAIIGLAFFSARPPRVQRYSLSVQGVQVGNKWYDFADFQGFSITADSPTTRSILLLPLKRFMPLITINLPPDREEEATNILGSVLPMQQRQGDAVDRFMSRLKF